MQPNQNQPNAPTPAVSPVQPTAPPPAYANPTPTVQPINNIQAPSQEQLQSTVNSLTSPNIAQTTIPPGPANQEQPTTAPIQPAPPVQAPPVPVQPQPLQPVAPQAQPMAQPTSPPPIPVQTSTTPQPTAQRKPTKEEQQRKATAQNSLLISEIRENMIIMNDGTFRAVVACDSINYDLMSSEEREGIEYSYQNFLNTLYFPVQISIQSRRIDLKPYTEKLEKIRANQENMLLGVLMDEYLDFIFDISQQANIMRKDFFVVVPFSLTGEIDSAVNSFKNLSEGVISSIQKPTNIKINAKDYQKAKDEVKNRVNTVVNGLMNIGVRAGQLPTRALSELYYNFYNPDTAIEEPIANYQDYTGLYTQKGTGEAPLPGMENM